MEKSTSRDAAVLMGCISEEHRAGDEAGAGIVAAVGDKTSGDRWQGS